MHFDPCEKLANFIGCDLVTVDLGWTRQQRTVPAAMRWLKDDPSARIITLIKPHYESEGKALRGGRHGVLDEEEADDILHRTLQTLPDIGVEALDWIASPIRGGKGGNIEYLALLRVLKQ